ncbi:hypothetical protein Tco_0796295 [Tanacetum coccineum]
MGKLNEQQKQRRAQVQFEAQHYTDEDWDLIRAKIEANAELSKSVSSSNSTHLYSNPNTDPNRMPLTKAKGQIPQKDKIHKIESMIKRFRKRYSRVVCPNEAAIEGNPGLMRN